MVGTSNLDYQIPEMAIELLYTVDGCEILHHQKDGWNPINNGMFTTYQLVQDFATIHW